MKKIVTLAAIAALGCGLVFADGPVANLDIAEFSGNAKVEWGVDLDAGKTGFKNAEYLHFKVNLFDAGTKSTSSDDDIWAELVLKAGNTGNWNHKLAEYDSETEYTADNVNKAFAGEYSINVDTAKFHIFNFYVGILNGDTQTGEYKFDAAIRGYDHWRNQAKWLSDVGPSGYSQGIVAGYADDNLDIGVDLRSYNAASTTPYTGAYALALEAKLNDSNEWLEGLSVDLGASVALTDTYYKNDGNKVVKTDNGYWDAGYSANAGYKLKIDDTYWFKPSFAYTGYSEISTGLGEGNSASKQNSNLVAGLMLGWGSAQDSDTGLYYLDGDDGANSARKITPGVSVLVDIPLASVANSATKTTTSKTTSYSALEALIVPSFWTNGELVEGLKAGLYSEIAILRNSYAFEVGGVKTDSKTEGTTDSTTVTKAVSASEEGLAFALAGALAYDIKADAITVTPQIGFRFANGAYFDNKINEITPLSNAKMFQYGLNKMGVGRLIAKKDVDGKSYTLGYENFFNLQAGVNVNGLVNNTDFYLIYKSANLANTIPYTEKVTVDGVEVANHFYNKDGWYNVKAGTITLGAKISL